MDPLTNLGLKLLEVTARNGASKIYEKRNLAKANKNKDETIRILEELINDLIDDKNELEYIAKQYKEEYEKTTISDENINHIKKSFDELVILILSFNEDEKNDEDKKSFDVIKNLINPDSMKTLQLLGYSFKEGLGTPLTELTAAKIRSYIPENNTFKNNGKQKNNGKRNRNKWIML